MVNLVKCKKARAIQLPNGVEKKVGDTVACPKSCPYKNTHCRSVNEFVVVRSKCYDSEDSFSGYQVVKYATGEYGEKKAKAENKKIENAPSKANRVGDTKERSRAETAFSGERAEVASAHEKMGKLSASETAKKYGSFGRKTQTTEERGRSYISSASDKQDDSSAKLRPEGSYDRFIIGGICFTNDPKLRRTREDGTLKRAPEIILKQWETNLVFKNPRELNDNFVWLLTETAKQPIMKQDVDNILQNDSLSLNQKFFYLFYDVIFKYNPPSGFYWCDESVSIEPMVAMFKDRRDFVRKYCDEGPEGEYFRRKYSERKREILHFLRVEDEYTFFKNMTLELAGSDRKIVLMDKLNDYNPVFLGTIETFVKDMHRGTDLSKMENMISFLEEYRVNNMGVFVRDERHPFERSKRAGLAEDESMYEPLGFTSSSEYESEYNAYMTLLREYTREFSPKEITIGKVKFTKSNFSQEFAKIAEDYCKVALGEADSNLLYKRRSVAWMTKNVYERKILTNFTCENDEYLKELAELIASPKLDKYFKLFRSPKIQFGNNEVSIHEYLSEIMKDDLYTVCGRMGKDKIVSAIFKSKVKKSGEDLNKLFRLYEEQYKDFAD